MRERNGDKDRDRERQIQRQTDRQTDRQQTDRHRDRDRETETERAKGTVLTTHCTEVRRDLKAEIISAANGRRWRDGGTHAPLTFSLSTVMELGERLE